MSRPSKKEIREAIEKLKGPAKSADKPAGDHGAGKPASKKSSQRIRKQGI